MEETIFQLGGLEITGPRILIISGVIIVLAIFALLILYKLSQKISKKIFSQLTTFKQRVLLVTVPKYDDASESENSGQPKSQQELAEKIAIMETFFSNIASLSAQKGLKYNFINRSDHLSLEIILKDGLIYFYVVVPEHLLGYIENQITAQFPRAMVQEVEDYNIFNPQGAVAGAMLKFKKEYLYPIKTYRKLENDSLNAITNALSKLDKDSGAAIQVIARSATSDWHKWGQKTASAAHQGKKISEAGKITQAPAGR